MKISRVLFFTAPWCKPCQQYKDMVPGICDELGIGLEISDVSRSAALSCRYNVGSLPTLVFVDEEEEEIGRIVGAYLEDRLRVKIDELLETTCSDTNQNTNHNLMIEEGYSA